MHEIQYAPAGSGEKSTNGLGVAALVIGILALLGSWVPFCGLLVIPMAIVGLVIGLVGVLVSVVNKRSGVGFPIAGSLVSCGAIVLALASTGAGIMAANGAAQQAAASQAVAATQPGALTLAKYKEITEGMTYAEVVAIVGAEGTESSSTKLASGSDSISIKLYTWDGPGLSRMTGAFQNSKLVSKSQHGLK